MSSEDSRAKIPRLDPAVDQSKSDADPATDIHDLIFSITGTMPAAVDEVASESGDRSLQPETELKRKSSSNETVNQPLPGALCFSPAASTTDSNSESSVVTEADVGITEFISQHEGFSGIIKQRFSDFVVNEISADGEIIHLTDLDLPAEEEEEVRDDLLSDEQLAQLKHLHDSKDSAEEFLIASDDKDTRGHLHRCIKIKFPTLDSNTIEKDGVKYICVRYFTRKADRKPRCFTKTKGDYCRFVLYKENNDTLSVVNLLARKLRVAPGSFTYAGTKDRRAKTTQELTAHRIPPSSLHKLNGHLRNISLGNFRICKEPLKLGDSRGNRFSIVIRNVTGSDDLINTAMTSLRDSGFINYYGMQRFGTTRVATHAIGRALLQGFWNEAVDLILKPREGDRHEMVAARKIWRTTHDAQKALNALRGFECTERRLFEGLKRCAKNDLVTALSFMPRNMRLMYVHAYQSRIWNLVVSRRIQEFGLTPRRGDLAYRGELVEDTDNTVEGDDSAAEVKNLNKTRIEPVLLTDDNITQFSIKDVVLPLPGFDVIYPDNESRSWYKQLLVKDGFDEDFNFQNKIKDYSLPGSYRKLILTPGELSWQTMSYDDYQQSLVLSDIDAINKISLPASSNDGKFKALRMELSLPPSTYATMAVREVLKCSTSAAFQSTLNVT